MDRRTFIAGALSVPLAASLPLSVIAAPAVPSSVWMGGAATDSFAWGSSPDEMIAALSLKMQPIPAQ